MEDVCGLHRLIHRFSTEEDMIDRGIELGFLYTEPGGGVALGIQVHQNRGALRQSQPGGETHRRCGLPNATLLIYHCNDLGYSGLRCSTRNTAIHMTLHCCTWNAPIS